MTAAQSVEVVVARRRREPRRFEALGRSGLIIVGAASAIMSLNQTSQSLVALPFVEWILHFMEGLAVNFVIGMAILLAAVWARDRYPTPGRAQYACALAAVSAAALIAALALDVHYLVGVVLLLTALWIGYYPGRARYAGASLVVSIAIFLAIVTLVSSMAPSVEPWGLMGPITQIALDLLRYAFVGMVITTAWLYTCTEADQAAAIQQCAVDSARMDEQTAEARLQMLEAQIEPHFLFNTLAHVKRLYETDRAAGARMLRNLEAYLGVALPQMRDTEPTLGREIEHTRAYLDIQQIRMGRRLAYGIDVDPALRDARLPPMMVLTLVENAIKHGLTPVPAGGRIDVRARLAAGRLRVEVADTGGGFTKSGGKGAGLANIRARLAAQFGQDASLALALNTPSGVVATLELPYVPASGETGAP